MRRHSLAGLALTGGAILLAAAPLGAQTPPPPAPPTTLWNFLGIPQGIHKIQDNILNRHGNFPGLERKPPMLRIGDPANLESANPAIKKAAEIKVQEDLKKQKIKALKYLGEIGCGCYPGVKEALLAALDDCTEMVRLEAVQAFQEAAGNQCSACNETCCDEDVLTKLAEIAYEKDDCGCWIEPSERVRAAAADAIRVCCPYRGPFMGVDFVPGPVVEPEPIEREPILPEGIRPEGIEPEGDLPPPPPVDSSVMLPSHRTSPQFRQISDAISTVTDKEPADTIVVLDSEFEAVAARSAARRAPQQQRPVQPAQLRQPRRQAPAVMGAGVRGVSHTSASPSGQNGPQDTVAGQILRPAADGPAVLVWFQQGWRPHLGSRVQVYQDHRFAGELEIVESRPEGVKAQPIGSLRLSQLQRGDRLVYEERLQHTGASRPAETAALPRPIVQTPVESKTPMPSAGERRPTLDAERRPAAPQYRQTKYHLPRQPVVQPVIK